MVPVQQKQETIKYRSVTSFKGEKVVLHGKSAKLKSKNKWRQQAYANFSI